MMEPVPAELRALLDRDEIERLLKRYARALDDKDYDVLDSCFTMDARIDFSEAGGIDAPYPEVKTWLKQVLDPLVEMQHFITNVEVELENDTATGRTYTLNVNGIGDTSGAVRHMVVGAVYEDRFVRTGQGWRIAQRREYRLCTMGHRFGPDSN